MIDDSSWKASLIGFILRSMQDKPQPAFHQGSVNESARRKKQIPIRKSLRGKCVYGLSCAVVGGAIGYAGYEAAGLALPMTFLHFSRGFEAEADYLGMQYMYKSGYDPQAFISFFEKVQAQEKKKPGTLAKAFSTHPQTPDRISKSQDEISQILPARAEYTGTKTAAKCSITSMPSSSTPTI